MKLLTFFSAASFIFLSAFLIKKENAASQPLAGTKWSLKKIHTPSGTEDVNTKAFIRFNPEKNSAGGNGGCNSFGSTFTQSGNAISISNVISTKMYCEGIQASEDAFFKQLEKSNRFGIKDKTLFLYHDKELLLEFEETNN